MNATIPLVDLRAQYETIRAEIEPALARVLARANFIGGEDVQRFENAFAAYCQASACVGVGNGTDALYVALRALGVGPGDEVITVSHTFIATAEAISLTGARPVFVDVDEATMLLDPDAAAAAITPRTKAIVPVHLYGQPVNMDRLGEVARRHRLVIVEDAAQAHGARWQGRRVGTLGDVACFSFYPGKNLGAYGDAGAVVTNQGALGQRVRMLANHGRTEKYLHEMEGVNSRLDTVQAAILDVKLRHLDAWNEARRQVAARYLEALQGSDMRLPQVQAAAEPVWHLFVVRVPRRDRLLSRLKEHGIAAGIHYPIPLHLQPAYRHLGIKEGALPITERVAQEIISLPIYPELPLEAVERIAGTVRQLLRD